MMTAASSITTIDEHPTIIAICKSCREKNKYMSRYTSTCYSYVMCHVYNGLFHLIAIHPLWMTSEENLIPGHN